MRLDLTGKIAHVFPLGDLLVHDLADDGECPCGPIVQPRVFPEIGHVGWIVEHRPADGRKEGRRWGCKPAKPD